VKVQRLSSTDGFIVWDLDDASSASGVVRLAPKVLQDGAVLLARSTTYAFASFGVQAHGGASAAVNAKTDVRDEALAAFVEEVKALADDGKLRLAPSVGTSGDDLAPLGWDAPDPTVLAAGAIAASRVAGPLDWRTAAVVGSGPIVDATTSQLAEAGATVVDGRFDSDCDVLFVAGKAGVLDHGTAENVKASLIVPLTTVPVTARALAVLGKADRTVVPDFLSTAAPLLATHDPDGGDPVQRVRDAAIALADQGTNMWLAAAHAAEANLATWTPEKPFGRPLA
jgi:glutamate dehydrogenase/leucine dehydrogenase